MAVLRAEGVFKNKIIKLFIKNPLLVRLINPKKNESLDDVAEVLLGFDGVVGDKRVYEQGHIFDHDFADDTTITERTFIFVETQVPTVNVNSPLIDFNLYITVFTCHRLVDLSDTSVPTKNEMKKLGYMGNRIDILCAVIDEILNGYENLGIGRVMPSGINYTTIYKPKVGYYGKQLRYTVKGYNAGSDLCELMAE